MVNEHTRKYLSLMSLRIWEVQIKIKMKCHFSPTRLVKLKMSYHMVCLYECNETKTLIYSWRDVSTTVLGGNLAASKKIKNGHTLWPRRSSTSRSAAQRHCYENAPKGMCVRAPTTSLEMQDQTLLDVLWCIHTTLWFFFKQILQFDFVNVYIQVPGCYN